jgi:predicted O-methyltransferase YrrM
MPTPQEVIANDAHHDIDMHVPWLTSVAKGNIFEIGVRTGVSTSAFLLGIEKNGGHLWSVDNNPATCDAVDSPHWTFISGSSRQVEAIKKIIPKELDILFVDGDHSYEGVRDDLKDYHSLVKSGGRIICHDVVSAYDPGVRRAFDEFVAATGYEFEIFKSWVGVGQILVP